MGKMHRPPPAQRLTADFPVPYFGGVPYFDKSAWNFKLYRLVEKGINLTYDRFLSLPQREISADFHCVTGWSRYDNLWGGAPSGHG